MLDVDVRQRVRAYYGEVLSSTVDLKTNACCAAGEPPRHLRRALAEIHEDVLARFYGCGFPIPDAIEGATVLDLGCGTGRDVFLIAQLVGEGGRVHGLDMTPEQLEVARATRDWHTRRFGHAESNVYLHEGIIEDLSGFEDSSVDVVVSNCVVNLSPRKDLVFSEVARVLRPGGEFHLADVVCDRRLPDEVAGDPVLYGECLGGALYENDLLSLACRCGFADPRRVVRHPIHLESDEVSDRVGEARFYSDTWRLFCIDGLEDRCEDYGQSAIYRGGIPGSEHLYRLDDHHDFERGRPERICGNTASMLAESRLASFFEIAGDRSVHFGEFPCEPTLAARRRAVGGEDGPADAACC